MSWHETLDEACKRITREAIEQSVAEIAAEFEKHYGPSSPHPIARAGLDVGREAGDDVCATCGHRRREHGGTWCFPFVSSAGRVEIGPDDPLWLRISPEARERIERLNALDMEALAKVANFPIGASFAFSDEPGEHDPCHVVLPGGAMVAFAHCAEPDMDVARALFVARACNAALAPSHPRPDAEIDPYAHADGSRECRPAAGKWSRPDAAARARELLAAELLATGLELGAENVRDGIDEEIWSDVAIRAIAKALAPAELNENGWHLPSVNEGLRIARECNAPEIRRQVVEECARVARSYEEGLKPPTGWSKDWKDGYEFGVADCSSAIEGAIRQIKGDTHE